jgi:hypothetical protein
MKWPRFDNRYLIPIEMLALFATALLTPWWGTVVVVATLRLMFFSSVRRMALFSFFGWTMACVYRDSENAHGPSRIFAKLMSLTKFGFAMDSDASRWIVYGTVASIGLLLALFTAGAISSFQQMFTTASAAARARR